MKAARAPSSVERLPMFVRSRPSGTCAERLFLAIAFWTPLTAL